jgi:hypothetical protein
LFVCCHIHVHVFKLSNETQVRPLSPFTQTPRTLCAIVISFRVMAGGTQLSWGSESFPRLKDCILNQSVIIGYWWGNIRRYCDTGYRSLVPTPLCSFDPRLTDCAQPLNWSRFVTPPTSDARHLISQVDPTTTRVHHRCKSGPGNRQTSVQHDCCQGHYSHKWHIWLVFGIPSPCSSVLNAVSLAVVLTTSAVRDTLGTSLYFMEYDAMRSLLGRSSTGEQGPTPGWLPIHGSLIPFVCGSLAGVTSWALIYPLDV